MKQSVAVVDYGVGNVQSVVQALRSAAQASNHNVEVLLTSNPNALARADRLVLPGQGAMASCMGQLHSSGLYSALKEAARHKPLLGICVGMQMLLEHSEEGDVEGLGLVPGQVQHLNLQGQVQADGSPYKVPHMGWNRVTQIAQPPTHPQAHPLWEGIPNNSHFYFVHSFFVHLSNPQDLAGQTEYGKLFCSALAKDNLFATQFHPEKSADQGLRLFQNFLNWKP